MPIRVKAGRFSAEQREFLDAYLKKHVNLGFSEEMASVISQAASHLVNKNESRSKYRLAINLRPVNAATMNESWPMPHLDSKILDFKGSVCFAVLDFASAYWQVSLHAELHGTCGIVGPKGVFVSKRVLPGPANATSYFHSTVAPLFQEMRNNTKALLK